MAPIVLLPAPDEDALNPALEQAYVLITEGLKAIGEGTALDISQN